MSLQWWHDLSIFKRLYTVVGVMALLIALELFTLRFAMGTLSAVRAFVGGEGMWSKAQKSAVSNLEKYVLTGNIRFFEQYQDNLRVPMGDHKARLGMERNPPDMRLVYEGFIEGRIHPDDIDGLVHLFVRFHSNKYLARAISLWREADVLLEVLKKDADEIHQKISNRQMSRAEAELTIVRLERFDQKMTMIEDDFSYALGEGSRWLESTVLLILLLAVVTIEGTGLYLTFTFSRHLSRGLKEVNVVAEAIGQGRLDTRLPVRSKDELGRLAGSINQMAASIQENVGEKHQAEAASQWKSLFLANMSHEIRTPLGAMLGFTELLQDATLKADERDRYLEIVKRTGENLNKIINDILDLSKVEAGRLDFERVDFDLRKLILDLEEILKLRARERHIELVVQERHVTTGFICTDPTRLRQIVLNLVGNAIKFSPPGGVVRVQYSCNGTDLQVSVSDNGPGISAEHRARLFQPFSQVGNGSRVGGTGLGLFLSRRLAIGLGGDLILETSPNGHGSTFTMHIPVEPARHFDQSSESLTRASRVAAASASNGDALLVGKRILLVDDTAENLLLLERVLKKRGAYVLTAVNGEEGVAKAVAGDVDLVLMDMMMPVMDGYEATRQLRARGFHKPIIAITAHAMKDDRDKCFSAGCTGYLPKPIQTTDLIRMVASHVIVKIPVEVPPLNSPGFL